MAHKNLAVVRLPMQQHALKKDVVKDPINDKTEEANDVFDSNQAELEEELLYGPRCQKRCRTEAEFPEREGLAACLVQPVR